MKNPALLVVSTLSLMVAATCPSLAKTPTPAKTPGAPPIIAVKTMAFPISTGLYINVNVTNRSLGTVRILFPSSARVEVQAFRDGCPLWNSSAGQRFTPSVSTVLLQGEQIDTFSEFWPFKPGTVGGKILLKARLLATTPTAQPAQPIVVDLPVIEPSPSTSPSPGAQPTDACATPMPAPTGQIRTLPHPERRRPL